MNVKIVNNELVITLPMIPRVSASGKSLVVASTNGNKSTSLEYKGKPIVIGVNAYISNS